MNPVTGSTAARFVRREEAADSNSARLISLLSGGRVRNCRRTLIETLQLADVCYEASVFCLAGSCRGSHTTKCLGICVTLLVYALNEGVAPALALRLTAKQPVFKSEAVEHIEGSLFLHFMGIARGC